MKLRWPAGWRLSPVVFLSFLRKNPPAPVFASYRADIAPPPGTVPARKQKNGRQGDTHPSASSLARALSLAKRLVG